MTAEDIPYGYCQCGCGELAPIATSNCLSRGYVKGEPKRFVHNHHRRADPPMPWTDDLYRVEDCGYLTPCHIWAKARDKAGYGKTTLDRQHMSAHRRAWLSLVGPIPDGYELDHLCRNRACVNIAHLEVVTHQVNVQRGHEARGTTRPPRDGGKPPRATRRTERA